MLDYVIKNAQIFDGTGSDSYHGDIGIQNGRLVAMGRRDDEAAKTLDGSGLIACPGFIDMHTHMDIALLKEPFPDANICQGVTTDLIGQDGLGTFPASRENQHQLALLLAGLNGSLPSEQWTWGGFDEYVSALVKRGLPSNVAILASHGPIRMDVMGMRNEKASAGEMQAMGALLADILDKGAFGLSTGLIYPPCSYGDEAELTELAKEVGRRDGVFVVHMRDEGYHLLRSIDEVARVCMNSGAKLHISHFEAFGKVNWHLMDDALVKLDEYAQRGLRISWDRYPYLAGCTVLSAVLPPWAFEEGPERLVEKLSDGAFRERIHEAFTQGLDIWNNRQISVGWENVVITAVQKEANKWMQGLSCRDIADKQNKNAVDAICDLLQDERLNVTMVTFYGTDTVLEKVLAHPWGAVGSDGIYGGRPHPRLYGSFPKFLRDFSLNTGRLPLQEAIRKITSLPADILGIRERGRLREGYWADIVLFDPMALRDRGTYDDPVQYPEGIRSVFVNGVPVVDRGCTTGLLPGQVLKRERS